MIANATMTGSPVRLTTGPQRAMQLIFAPGAVIYYVGDSAAVSATLGIPVEPAAANVQPVKIGPFTSGAIILNQWYANGASGTITFQYTPEE